MNLSEFINHSKKCPICGNGMGIKLSSTRSYKVKQVSEAWSFSTTMSLSISSYSGVDVDLIFSCGNDDFYVQFHDRAKKLMSEYVPTTFISIFKEFILNQKGLLFERRCGMCYQYGYTSHKFDLDYKTATLKNLKIDRETICYYKKVDDENTRVFKISSDEYSSFISHKEVKSKDLENMYPFTGMHIDFDNKIKCDYKLDVFSGANENIDKLETLITFS